DLVIVSLAQQLLNTREDRLGRQDHAGTAAVRIIIHLVMLILRVIPQVMDVDCHQILVTGFAYDAVGQWPFQQLRNGGYDINTHISYSPFSCSRFRHCSRWRSSSTAATYSSTKGMSSCSPSSVVTCRM